MKYYINYGTGAGNEVVEGTLEDAKRVADDGAEYTQQDIVIHDYEKYFDYSEINSEITRRCWYGVELDEEIEDVDECICFGNFGYYAPWSKWC